MDAYKPHYKKYQGKHYAAFPFKVKCDKGYTKVQVKQYYYAEDKYGNSHERGSDYYQYSFNHHGGETWGGGQWRHVNHHQDKKVYHVVKYRYWASNLIDVRSEQKYKIDCPSLLLRAQESD